LNRRCQGADDPVSQDFLPAIFLHLFVLGNELRIIQPFTGNTDTLIAAAEAWYASIFAVTSEDEHLTYEFLINNSYLVINASRGNAGRLQSAFNTQIKVQENQRAEKTLQAFTALAQAVSGYPGRKNVMCSPPTFPFALVRRRRLSKDPDQRYYLKPFQKVATMLAASQIAVYPLTSVAYKRVDSAE